MIDRSDTEYWTSQRDEAADKANTHTEPDASDVETPKNPSSIPYDVDENSISGDSYQNSRAKAYYVSPQEEKNTITFSANTDSKEDETKNLATAENLETDSSLQKILDNGLSASNSKHNKSDVVDDMQSGIGFRATKPEGSNFRDGTKTSIISTENRNEVELPSVTQSNPEGMSKKDENSNIADRVECAAEAVAVTQLDPSVSSPDNDCRNSLVIASKVNFEDFDKKEIQEVSQSYETGHIVQCETETKLYEGIESV